MNKHRKQPLTVEECKIQASILLKSLCSESVDTAKQAAKRFQCLPEFSQLSIDELLKTNIKRKHALAAVALEKGFKSWTDLKTQIPFIVGGYLNQWFANHEEAKSQLQNEGGFLLPFKHQFFICNATYIKQLGFCVEDSDWALIDYDWVKPSNQKAWQRLNKKWDEIQVKNNQAKYLKGVKK